MGARRAATVLAAVAAALLGLSGPAHAQRWAPADEAAIHPGTMMYTKGAQCTANFVFTDARSRVYVGYAAHCAGLGEATDTNGCTSRSVPLGTRVRFARGGTLASGGETVGRGRLAYSSWRTMRRIGLDPASNACAANDFALVRVAARHVDRVNPSVPVWGGPTSLGAAPESGETVYTYGQSSLRPGETLSPKTGTSLGRTSGGWGFDAYTATPGVPGDSGSGYLDSEGRAVGTLSTVAIAPLPGSNGLGTLGRELGFAQRHSGIAGLRLVAGTRDFDPTAVPVG
jgi:hypothetical protein